ncbi:MAG: glyoxalase/bleomycin resistance/dioxygenase family protein [Deltaproteobacteria bacterium HGW-Deltaproteobacteria-21]|nr:MAG: glyoxalase/bleomycin resistance/dioxygenase family protein [Deltaproteobacteria bacterium HGW-Deltaproteobacteria-21]
MENGRMEAIWHHVAISVKDMENELRFYRDLLGFEVDWERENYTGEMYARVVGLPGATARVVMLKGYGGRIELFKYRVPEGDECGPKRQCDFGLTHFAIMVKGIHEIHERLVKAGVHFNCPPQNLRPGVWATYMKDPEGVTIELVEYE